LDFIEVVSTEKLQLLHLIVDTINLGFVLSYLNENITFDVLHFGHGSMSFIMGIIYTISFKCQLFVHFLTKMVDLFSNPMYNSVLWKPQTN
jgi:hypothetical protein